MGGTGVQFSAGKVPVPSHRASSRRVPINAVVKLDTRTPAEVIQGIQHHAAIVAQSLQTLQQLLTNEQPATTE